MSYVGLIVQNTPMWVYGVFALLLYLGLSRLRPRRSRLGRAMLAPLAFFVWSAWSAVSAAITSPQPELVGLSWLPAFLLGWWSCRFHVGGSRPEHLGGGEFLFAATAVPLIAYMLLFWTRFGLEVWPDSTPSGQAGFVWSASPSQPQPPGRTWGDVLRLRTLMKGPSPLPAVVSPQGAGLLKKAGQRSGHGPRPSRPASS
jgi:hypothetical protein